MGEPTGDCGYLVNPNDVSRSRILLSFGIGDNWTFEKQFQDLTQCDIIAYDAPTDRDIPGREEFFQHNRRLVQQRVGHAGADVDQILRELPTDIFLKCDIESSEWYLLDDLINHQHKFTGIVLEVHELNQKDHIDRLTDFMCRIGLRMVHLHVNNWFYYVTDDGAVPDVLELTFSSDTNTKLDRNLTLPHKLDSPNNPQRPEFSVSWG